MKRTYGNGKLCLYSETVVFRNYERINNFIFTFKRKISNFIALLFTQNIKLLIHCDRASVHVLVHVNLRF